MTQKEVRASCKEGCHAVRMSDSLHIRYWLANWLGQAGNVGEAHVLTGGSGKEI